MQLAPCGEAEAQQAEALRRIEARELMGRDATRPNTCSSADESEALPVTLDYWGPADLPLTA